MNATDKPALRAAVLIRERLTAAGQQATPLYLPEYSWDRLHQLQRQIDLARRRGWHLAAAQLNRELVDTLDDCRRDLERAKLALEQSPPRPIASATETCGVTRYPSATSRRRNCRSKSESQFASSTCEMTGGIGFST